MRMTASQLQAGRSSFYSWVVGQLDPLFNRVRIFGELTAEAARNYWNSDQTRANVPHFAIYLVTME
jgi:hypothetical protein